MTKANRLSVAMFCLILISIGTVMIFIYWRDGYAYSSEMVLGCLGVFFLSILYFVVLTIWKMRLLNKYELKERTGTFLKWFAGLSVMNLLFSYFTASDITGYEFFTSFGLAVGIAFSDVMFLKKKSY
ncbi:hypothetical protein IQ283_12600 [Alkalihalobacillus hwajinpoensis]|uniref:hypothetical protein n=1 Tax=Guptibacillus hwajinpoensis TaxID=208199 RepID=UPI0018838754|nr:hypothetical protein [Pseudalkalibacillus hwajinpoensis]MBF0707428.1 hypothetical protein [Pseudalkalibacillus hwajinpoensis]